MHRPTVGIIALLLFAGAVYFWLFPPRHGGFETGLHAAFIRLTMVMGALWLAHPQLRRVPWWVTIGLFLLAAGALLAVLRQPRMLLLLIPIAAALWATRGWNKRPAMR
jgi:hypothetical protein